MSRVSAIVVTHNHRGDVTRCLSSLEASSLPPHELLVLDHDSDDGTAELVRRRFPRAVVLDYPDNPGFGEGVNRGLRIASGELVFLLNPDAFVLADCLERLAEALGEDPRRAVAVPKVTLVRRPERIHSAGLRVNRIGYACDRGYLERDEGQYDAEHDVLAGSGCALMLRTAAVREVGGFDPAYFLYYEDLDLCWRLWILGHRVRYIPGAVARHASRLEGRSRRFDHFVDHRNRFRTLLKNMETGTLVGRFPRLVVFEVLSVLDLGRRGWLRALGWRLRAWGVTLGGLPSILRQRRWIQSRRVIDGAELAELFTPDWGHPPPRPTHGTSGPRRNSSR